MNAAERPFLMCVEDVFGRTPGREVMLTGQIERGRVRKDDEVEIVGLGGSGIVPVAAIEASRRRIDEASADMNVGLLLTGLAADAVTRGQVLAAPGTVDAHVGFAADIMLLSEEHGAAEVRTGDRLQFHVRTAVVLGVVTLPHHTDVLHPLHMGTATVTLDQPIALEEGQSVSFRHHGRAAGSGTVTQVLRRVP
ncbi:EF-Tu/IF-2/RF-3 family GTPase [Streptomyces sp. NPDC050804]|uniref:EF-Tu/IF-2/RF-3 family GTPase n=1 Tax=Streptomyces sp. NPDC050804 TaxID=3154745 RepID=UPI00343709EA